MCGELGARIENRTRKTTSHNTPHHDAPAFEKDYSRRSMVFGAVW
jgi:hypothetical protein